MNKSSIKKISPVALVSFLLIAGYLTSSAQLAGPQFMITWRAKSYVPSQYTGKIMPTAKSIVTASFELLNQGKLVNLSGQTIYWYLNDRLLDGASGKQTATFKANDSAPDVMKLQIQLPDWSGGFLFKEINIPVASPEAVIESPYTNGTFGGAALGLHGTPYFFSVPPEALKFSWSVNGQTPTNAENPQDLQVSVNPDAPSGSTLNISLSVQNPKNDLETASANTNLNLIK